MSLTKRLAGAVGGLLALALFGCGPTEAPRDFGDISGVEEISQPLPAIAGVTFATGTLTIPALGTVIVSKHAVSGNILVNDVVTAGATSTAVKNIVITGTGAVETIILDFANGTFAPGVQAGPGITYATGGAADLFKIRGQATAADTISVGGTGTAMDIAFNTDTYKDIAVTGATATVNTFSLGGGNDVLNATTGAYGTGGAAFTGALTVFGGEGDDTLTGGDGADTFYGDNGNDTMNGGTNTGAVSDVYNGGGGTADVVTYAGRAGAITVTVGAGANDGASGVETDNIMADVEIVRGGNGNDTFTGWTGNQTFYGGVGDDTFLMGLVGTTGAGDDTVYGEAGTDTVNYSARTATITVTMDLNVANDGEPTIELDNIRDDVENLICPSTAAVSCTVTGNGLANTLTGGGGLNTLTGGSGDDTLIAGTYPDVLSGGTGDDIFTVGAAATGAVHFIGGAGVDTVDFSTFGATIGMVMDGVTTGFGQGGAKVIDTDVENLTCPTASVCVITGNAGNNRIVGSSALDTISSLGGDDFIETVNGNDVVTCGDGSDIMYVAAGTPVNAAADCEL